MAISASTEMLLLSALGSPEAVTDFLADLHSITASELAAGQDAANIADGSVSNTEFQYLNGVTSAIQTQMDLKAPLASPTFTTSTRHSYGTASTVPYFDASKDLVSSAVTPTELGYVSGVTSALQTQLNNVRNGSFDVAGAFAEVSTTDGGAISVSKILTSISSAGAETRTLAAPPGACCLKVIQMTVDGGDVTLSLANVVGAPAATTATFDDVGDTLVLMSAASKWVYIGGSATCS